MLINPSLHNFLENITFDFQITRDPVQISNRHDVKITKNADKMVSKSQK